MSKVEGAATLPPDTLTRASTIRSMGTRARTLLCSWRTSYGLVIEITRHESAAVASVHRHGDDGPPTCVWWSRPRTIHRTRVSTDDLVPEGAIALERPLSRSRMGYKIFHLLLLWIRQGKDPGNRQQRPARTACRFPTSRKSSRRCGGSPVSSRHVRRQPNRPRNGPKPWASSPRT